MFFSMFCCLFFVQQKVFVQSIDEIHHHVPWNSQVQIHLLPPDYFIILHLLSLFIHLKKKTSQQRVKFDEDLKNYEKFPPLFVLIKLHLSSINKNNPQQLQWYKFNKSRIRHWYQPNNFISYANKLWRVFKNLIKHITVITCWGLNNESAIKRRSATLDIVVIEGMQGRLISNKN